VLKPLTYTFSRLKRLLANPAELPGLLSRSLELLRHQGYSGLLQGFRRDRQALEILAGGQPGPWRQEYQQWIEQEERRDFPASDSSWPGICLVLLVGKDGSDLIDSTIDSVLAQTNKRWQLILVGDGAASFESRQVDTRIEISPITSDQFLKQPTQLFDSIEAEFLLILEPGHCLAPHALALVCRAFADNQATLLCYSDEDLIDNLGQRSSPCFKPDCDPLLLMGQNFIGGLAAYSTQFVRSLNLPSGGTVEELQWQWALKACQQPERVVHLALILFHRKKRGLITKLDSSCSHAHFLLPESPPLVSIIIPTHNGHDILKRCLDSITGYTKYQNVEIIVVDNGSNEPESLAYLKALGNQRRTKVLIYDKPFNYSAINNFAARQAQGELLCFMNNDVEVSSADWLGQMLAHTLQPQVGAVGAMLYYPDQTIQHAGIAVGVSPGGAGGVAANAFCGLPRGFQGQGGRLQFSQRVSAVTGACLLVRQQVFEEVGGFDQENLPITFNDVDLCLRLEEMGMITVFTPWAELYHHESKSRGMDDSSDKQVRFGKEVLYMRQRWGDRLTYDPAFPRGELSLTEFF